MPHQLPSYSNADATQPLPMLRPLPTSAHTRRSPRGIPSISTSVRRALRGTMRRVLRGLAPACSGELGANGLILESIVEPSAGAKVAATVFGVAAERKGKAVASYVHAN